MNKKQNKNKNAILFLTFKCIETGIHIVHTSPLPPDPPSLLILLRSYFRCIWVGESTPETPLREFTPEWVQYLTSCTGVFFFLHFGLYERVLVWLAAAAIEEVSN